MVEQELLDCLTMPKILTRKDHEIEWKEKGVTGAALEALLAETAHERHESRVAHARWAAEEYYLGAANLRREEVSQDVLTLFAGAILWADVAGIGGRGGVEGTGTARHPAFAECGKGRKRASDGGAWSAAIRDAARLCSGCFRTHVYDDGRVVLAFARAELIGNEWHLSNDIVVYETIIPAPWMLSICREGLRRAAGLRWPATIGVSGWHVCFPIHAPPESLANWATLVNEVTNDE